MPQTTYSVVICAHSTDRWDDLTRSVESVLNQTLRPAETIVVIDSNRTLLRRAELELAGVHAIPNGRTKGLSGARNTGVLAAESQIVAFLDDDAVASADWLESLDRHYRLGRFGGRRLLGVGGAAIPKWDTGRPRWFPREFDWVVGCSHTGLPTRVASVRNPIGCNMSFWRKVIVDAGGFDERLGRLGSTGSGCEETELCIRAQGRDAEGVIVYEPTARVRHRVRAERATPSYFVQRCLGEGASKALVARLRGSKSLATESGYVIRVLPLAVARALAARQNRSAKRAGAIGLGLVATSFGFLRGRWAPSSGPQDPRLLPALRADDYSGHSANLTNGRRAGGENGRPRRFIEQPGSRTFEP